MTQEGDEGQRWKWVQLFRIWTAVPCSYSRPSLASWNITYYSSLMSHCLSHGDEWMHWQLIEEKNKGTRWGWHPAPTAYISNLFSVQLDRQLLSIQLDIQFLSYILYRCFCELCVTLAIPISCLMEKKKAGNYRAILFQLFTLTPRHLLWRTTAEVCPLVFVNVAFTLRAGRELTVQLSRKGSHTPTTVLHCFMFFHKCFSFVFQLSSQLSTLIKIWSMCTPSWMSASSPGWRWAPIDSHSAFAPDQWAAEPGDSERKN